MLSRLAVRRRRPVVDIGPLDLYANPYPIYRRLRQETPIAYAPALRHYAGLPDAYWLVSRWDDVVQVLKDDETFASTPEPDDLPVTFRAALPQLDGDRHAQVRSVMQPICTPRRAGGLAQEFVRATADSLVDEFEPLDGTDLVDAYLEPLAALTIARLLGLSDVPPDRLRTWFDHLGAYFVGELFPRDADLDREIDEELLGGLRRSEEQPDGSLLAAMAAAPAGGVSLTHDEMLGNAKFFAAAGVHELCDLVAHTLVGLFTRPEQLSDVRADPALAKAAVEEGARWSSPVGMVPRATTLPVQLAGVRLPRGAYVAALIGSANRDEAHWTEPATFDLHRDEGMHLAYASGAHFCIGAWVARAAGTVALERLLERLPRIRLNPDDRLIVTGWRFRDVRRLPARWS
jgi:hypothetical protein